MKTKYLVLSIFIFSVLQFISYANIFAQELSSKDVFDRVSGSVLQLKAFDSDSSILGWGSAVAVGDSGLIYSNMHIFQDAYYFEIVNGTQVIHDVKIVGFNPDYDILIFKIPAGVVRGVPVSNSDSIHIGEVCFALGNPQGYLNTFSSGIISGIRYIPQMEIQYTASISSGSSGGALLNSKGELIGITSSANKTGQNLNFAVPVNYFINTGIIDYNDSLQCKMISELVKLNNSTGSLSSEILSRELAAFDSLTLGNRNTLYTSAGLYSRAHMYDKALDECNYGLIKYPGDKEFYLRRATVYRALSMKSEAISDYNSAISIDSNYEAALFNKSDFFTLDSSNYKEALNCLLKIVNTIAGREYLYLNIAMLYLDHNDTLNAYKSLQRSYSYLSFNAESFEFRGWLFERMEKYDEAVWDFSSAIILNPDEQSYYLSRAVLYSKKGRPDKALSDYLRVLNFNSEDITALNNLAYAYYDLGDMENAEKYFLKSISIHNDHFDSFIGLSITYNKLNKINNCLHSMSSAIRIKPVLMLGMAGLDSLCKSGNFWSGKERNAIKDVFIKMGYENEPFYTMDDNDAGVSKPRQIRAKNGENR